MTLTRAALATGHLQRLVRQVPELASHLLSEAELQDSIRQTLQQRSVQADVWIFAYGSLIWNPVLHYCDRAPAKIYGWHRQFCMRTPAGRGTPEHPGLVLALERGGSCRGIAYRIAAEHLETELLLLWRREMIVGSYIPRWVKVSSNGEDADAIAFTINPCHPLYAPNLSVDEMAKAIASARGFLGPCVDYLVQTIEGLASHDIVDRRLLAVRERVLELR